MMATKNTREHLIDVGLQLIHSTGYNATGVKEILDHAGVPKGSFYHYFPSKEAFAKEVLLRYATGEAERAERILGDTRLRPLNRLRKYFEELLSVYGQTGPISGCLIGNLSLEVADRSVVLQPALSAVFSHWQQPIADVLRAAMEKGDLARSTKPDELAAFLLNNWEGALVRSKAEKSDQPLELFLHFTFNVLLKK
jgi:TetR/AcrR family transcriptional regulator, transcriptional repressor for nem operon